MIVTKQSLWPPSTCFDQIEDKNFWCLIVLTPNFDAERTGKRCRMWWRSYCWDAARRGRWFWTFKLQFFLYNGLQLPRYPSSYLSVNHQKQCFWCKEQCKYFHEASNYFTLCSRGDLPLVFALGAESLAWWNVTQTEREGNVSQMSEKAYMGCSYRYQKTDK